MKTKIVWTASTVRFVEEQAMLNEIERKVLEARVYNVSRLQMADYFGFSVSTIDRILKNIFDKYDAIQREFPDVLQPRFVSKEEEYMNTH